MATTGQGEIGCYHGDKLVQLVEHVDRLVSLPDVYYRLEALIERPDSSLGDIARLLSAEPDLCARLLGMANSAFYSFPVRIESIDRAVQVIGIRQIRELVLATSIANAFSQVPLGMIDMRRFWEHSVATGVMAKCLGQRGRRRQLERYYVAGLLHDIGRLAFFLKLPGLMSELLLQRERVETPLFRLEQAALCTWPMSGSIASCRAVVGNASSWTWIRRRPTCSGCRKRSWTRCGSRPSTRSVM